MLAILLVIFASSCEDLTEINISPDKAAVESVSPGFILTGTLAGTADGYSTQSVYGRSLGITEAMQYLQRTDIGQNVNSFDWGNEDFKTFYEPLKSSFLLMEKASTSQDSLFYTGAGLIMKSFWFAQMTSYWGDIPYSEAMMAEEGLYKPVYDEQKMIFKGIIEDLKTANNLLKGVGVVEGAAAFDIMFEGDAMKWRQFCNSILLRNLMILSEKNADMSAIGINVVDEFKAIVNDKTNYPIIESNNDNAAIEFAGVTAFDSWAGGPAHWPVRSEFYRRKPCATFVNKLKELGDPRLTKWITPVDVQILVGDSEGYGIGSDGKVKRYITTYEEDLDTSMYVGILAVMPDADECNLGVSADDEAISALNSDIYLALGSNPHVSYLTDMYAQNTHPLVKSVLIGSAEVDLLLAEAALKGWIDGSALNYLTSGISKSFEQYEITDGSNSVYNTTNHNIEAFDLAASLANVSGNFNAADSENKLELLMEQKWISLWMTPQFWFDWRRTGYPDLGSNVIAGNNGQKIPVRLLYGNRPSTTNPDNLDAAIGRLSPAENSLWSKMWLLQGTNKPW
jgi:hypothetical protein